MAVEEAVEEATAVRATTAEEEVTEWAEDQAAEWWVVEDEDDQIEVQCFQEFIFICEGFSMYILVLSNSICPHRRSVIQTTHNSSCSFCMSIFVD